MTGHGKILIKGGSVVLKDRIAQGASILIKGQKIAAVGAAADAGIDALVIDASGNSVSPGFIDTHIHGDPATIFKNEIKNGMTSALATESCARPGELCEKALRARRFMEHDPLGPSLLGMRIEGPYISAAKAGAQDSRYIRRPDIKGLSSIMRRCSPVLKMVTIAPEQDGALPLIRMLAGSGIIASAGHSNATYAEAGKGVAAGIRHATHIFNAMREIDGREPGVIGAALVDERVFAEVILDLVHVPKDLFVLLIQMKGLDKVALVTDSVKASPQKGVRRSRGAYRFPDGRLAGSDLTMIEAVRNAVMACNLSLPDAVKLASLNPARLLGVQRRKGSIGPGKDADIVIFDEYFNVKMSIVRGKIIYRKKGF